MINDLCKQQGHYWSYWTTKSEQELMPNGLYWKSWQERWCYHCGTTEYSNFSYQKIGRDE